MQNKYVGDIGDFIKLGLLRKLSPDYRMGVVWWLVADEEHKGDGKHIKYFEGKRREYWQSLDAELFDELQSIVARNERSVESLQKAKILSSCVFFSQPIPLPLHYFERLRSRDAWIERARDAVKGCNLLFLDPDNGLEPSGFRSSSKKSIKSVTFRDLEALAKSDRVIIVYHHQTRQKGGHLAEIEFHADRLRQKGFARVDALRAAPYSPRLFYILNSDRVIRDRARDFAATWRHSVTWHPDSDCDYD